MRSVLFCSAVLALTLPLGPGMAQQAAAPDAGAVTGRATVVGSDTLSLGDGMFRLDGVDGIEFHQFCFVAGAPWVCGASAVRALQTLVDPSEISCVPAGPAGGGPVPAVCTADGLDLAEAMVADGWALALEGSRYRDLEAEARAAGRGVWQGNFIEPWTYRADIAAIEERYRERSLGALQTDAERAMTDAATFVYVLEGFDIVDAPAGTELTSRQARVVDLAPGFIEAAIEAREVFDWSAVAARAAAWEDEAVAAIKASAVNLLWEELQTRPSVEVNVFDALGYLTAMRAGAADWLAAGRQPVLLIRSPLVPSWFQQWFGDEPPPRAEVRRKFAITAPAYLGTIDGIDVYAGAVPDAASALFPADLLLEVAYGRDADGDILDMTRVAGLQGDLLVADFSMAFRWLDDEIVWLRYPQAEADEFYER